MPILEYRFNRYQMPVRTLDAHKVATQIVQAWVDQSDGSAESLIATLEETLKQVVAALCDA